MNPGVFAAVVVLVALFITLYRSACIVPQKKAYLVERLGRYRATLSAGLHILVPFIDRIAYKRDLKEVAIDVPPQQCVTRDNIIVEVDGLLYLQVTDPVKACVNPAKVMVAMVYQLLKEDASKCKKLVADFTPIFESKEEYFEAVEAMRRDFLAVEYMADNEVKLIY